MDNIPKEWNKCVLEELLDYIQPSKYIVESTEYNDKFLIPVLTAGKTFILGYTDEKENIFDELPVIIFDDFTTATKFVNFKFKVKSSAMKILIPTSKIVNIRYIYYYMQTIRQNVDTHKRYWISIYSKLIIDLPPLAEQKEIVSRIEELFSELDNGIENLKKAKEQIKTYRQSLLKNAFEGKLTEKWRKENPDKIETPEILLEKIKKAREEHYLKQVEEWEQQVKEWEENGKEGKKPRKPQKLKDTKQFTQEELSDYLLLPKNWIYVRLNDITYSVKDGPHYSPKYEETGIPFISGGNIRPNGIDFNKNIKYISKELHNELSKRCKPEIGDVLYTKGGTTGIARVNTYEIDYNVWVHVAVLKITSSFLPFFIQYNLNSPKAYRQSQKYTHGVGNQDLGLTRMVNIVLGVCSLEEQAQVIKEIESKISVCDKLEETIDESLEKSEFLRQSILKKAFSGELTKEWRKRNPDLITGENSAENLLKRIKAEKEE